MAIITGVRFKRMGKTYYFDPNELPIAKGDYAVVETARGVECGEVTIEPKEVPDEEIVQPLKKVLRIATPEDKQTALDNEKKEKWAMEVCQKKIGEHKLEMNLVEAEYSFDGSKIVFYFTADGRVDFRALVRDLASVFKTRIELRQIGVRDEVKLLGGLGPCGREVCCRSFLTDFAPVSIRMAKDQNLSLNPTKISGLCGRLMCCLGYEENFYQRTIKRCPKKGSVVHTSKGTGTVQEINILKERIKVRFENETDQSAEVREYRLDELDDQYGKATLVDVAQEKAAEEQEEIPDVVFMDGTKTYVEKEEPAAQSDAPKDPPAKPIRREGRRERPSRRPSGNRENRPNHPSQARGAEPGKDGEAHPRNTQQNTGRSRQNRRPNRDGAARKPGDQAHGQAVSGQEGARGVRQRRRPRPNQQGNRPRGNRPPKPDSQQNDAPKREPEKTKE